MPINFIDEKVSGSIKPIWTNTKKRPDASTNQPAINPSIGPADTVAIDLTRLYTEVSPANAGIHVNDLWGRVVSINGTVPTVEMWVAIYYVPSGEICYRNYTVITNPDPDPNPGTDIPETQ